MPNYKYTIQAGEKTDATFGLRCEIGEGDLDVWDERRDVEYLYIYLRRCGLR